MNKKLFMRIFFNLAIFASIFFTPWYIQLVLIFIGIIIFNLFWESLFFALFLDTIFSAPIEMAYNFHYFYTVIIILLFLLMQWIKRMIR